mgnify:CR=1 FL=1
MPLTSAVTILSTPAPIIVPHDGRGGSTDDTLDGLAHPPEQRALEHVQQHDRAEDERDRHGHEEVRGRHPEGARAEQVGDHAHHQRAHVGGGSGTSRVSVRDTWLTGTSRSRATAESDPSSATRA